MIRNWLGQPIEVGSVVGRGARDGDSSTFKIGRVIKINDDKLKVTVEWKFYSVQARAGTYGSDPLGFLPYPGWAGSSKVPCSVETVFLLTEEDLERAERLHEVYSVYNERWRNKDHMDKAELTARIEAVV